MITIEITQAEYVWAAAAGILRQQQSLFLNRNRDNINGFPIPAGSPESQLGYDNHITGAVAEFVASLALGVSWRGPGQFRGDDIRGFQVRGSVRRDADLILKPGDDDAARFISVCGGPLIWDLVGWIRAIDGKRGKVLRPLAKGRNPVYVVPRSELIADFSILGDRRRAL